MNEMNFHKEKLPNMLTLEGGECCAIAHAFAKNPDAVAALKKIVDPRKLKLLANEMINTESLSYLPSADDKISYEQMARAELKRLEADGAKEGFYCNHSKEEHVKHLNSVLAKVETKAN